MEFLLPIGFITCLSVLFAVVLAIAHKKLKVWEDPRIDMVANILPGANCGACGVPGCRMFAEKVVSREFTPAKCTVGGEENAQQVAELLGIDAGKEEKKVARLLCAGDKNAALQIAYYEGYPSCRSASVVTGGTKACTYGCLGLGDCEKACTFGAITMGENGLPIVDAEKCTACMDCVYVCPKGLFEIMPLKRHLIVQCKSQLAGDQAFELCRVACTACNKCVMDAPDGLMTMEDNLPVVNEKLLELEQQSACFRCPTKAIVWVERQQFPEWYTGEEI